MDGWFELPEQTAVCQVRAVLDREQRDRQENPNFKPEPGELLRVVNTREAQSVLDDPSSVSPSVVR